MAGSYVEFDGGRVWYQEAGRGPAVLLLHAGGADSRMWDRHLERFAQTYRTVRIDLPGAGASPFPDKPYVPNELFGRLLDVLGIDRAALVGVSAGGGLAIDFAIERPQRTWALVVVASGPRGIDDLPPDPRMQAFSQASAAGDRDRAAELFLQLWAPLRTSPELDGRIRRMVHDSIGMLEVRPKGLIRTPAWSAAQRLGEIAAPVLAIWGDRDLPQVGLVGERLVAGVPGARRVVLHGVDHFVPIRAPEPFAREVLAFLDQAAPAAPGVTPARPSVTAPGSLNRPGIPGGFGVSRVL
ncbi:MAG TPA: alpha/beta hydrolase [Actinomycetes bacterium]|nr:alpha/beta hydrolase [Actinomycetes bacterium]